MAGGSDAVGRGREPHSRLRSRDSHDDFVEATFDTNVNNSVPHRPQFKSATLSPLSPPSSSPLHAPHFPIPTANANSGSADTSRTSPAAPAAASTSSGNRYIAVPIQSPADSSVIEMNTIARRPGPLRNLPTALYADAAAAAASGAQDGRYNNDEEDVEKLGNRGSTAIDRAAAAGVAVATPPAVNDDQWYRDQIDYVRNQVEQMENLEVQRGQEARRIRSKWKRNLFLLFEDPSSSVGAFVINVFVTFMIIFSAVLTTVETIPSLHKGNAHVWLALELTIVAIFTIEFVLRFLGHTDTWRQAWNHAKSFITIIDALAIFPFYVELALSRDTAYEFRFTILRIFRLLRVFSAFKYSSLLQLSIEVMIVAIKRSADALLAFLLFVTLTVLLFSTLMYFAERGTWSDEREAFLTDNGEYSKFSSIPAAAYYSIVTLTTTGFGDMVPTTFFGKLVSFPMMISGILLIALPSIIVGRNFTQVWEAARKYRAQRPDMRPLQHHPGESLVDPDECAGSSRANGAGAGADGSGHCSDAHSSSRASRRSRRGRHQLRLRGRAGLATSRRDGSISSFESGPPRSLKRGNGGNGGSGGGSPTDNMIMSGGYAAISGGQREAMGAGASADPIDALARKDSFEMQALAARASDPEDAPDGYTHVDVIYDSDSSHGSLDASKSSVDHSDSHLRRRSRHHRQQRKTRRAGTGVSSTRRGRKGKESAVASAAASRTADRRYSSGEGEDICDYSDDGDNGCADTIRVSRLEWESLNAELAALRLSAGANSQILQAIAQHLDVPNLPPRALGSESSPLSQLQADQSHAIE
ncbi:hypothetical protein IWW48_002475 [Coemansia sp. RSA 1200]|nr:hypothetical protein IWW48_002475 [Coemansia sp. RSA 1200]